jgi:hypothetical protein
MLVINTDVVAVADAAAAHTADLITTTNLLKGISPHNMTC